MTRADGLPDSASAAPAFPIVIDRLSKGDAEIRVALDEFRGCKTVDVRLFEAFTPAKVPTATKRGITLAINRLPELARALAEAEAKAKARELGLIGGDL